MFQGPEDGHVCFECARWLGVQYRECAFVVNASTPRKRVSRHRKRNAQRVVPALISAVKHSNYRKAFRQLIAFSPATRRAFDSIVSQQVRQQIKTLLHKKDLVFPLFDGSKSVESFSWASTVGTFSRELPTLYAAVSASMPIKFVNNQQPTYVSISNNSDSCIMLIVVKLL